MNVLFSKLSNKIVLKNIPQKRIGIFPSTRKILMERINSFGRANKSKTLVSNEVGKIIDNLG